MAKIGNHAVVLGASMAGLLAARSLSEFFDAVTVAERDPLPDTGAARRGVPQVGISMLLDEHDVVELSATPDHHRVTGARLVNRCTGEDADLVVDATGRAAHTPTWLNHLGYDRPREDHVAVRLTYVSQLLRMAPDALHELGFVAGVVPGLPHGLGILHCENDTWMFTVFGIAGHEPR
jgi:glycine/D-amino acid oxidase-like deaminating enzyme